ncbi:uncharacterized protein F5147DRAFT_656953 [Suillus discolor]|uniref:Thioester reductase (TE) domain-containing protein n=1 Tax=Suillus discolor TaxID=1912936 RepID=A0A9P7EX73_9AGAM|nr:uncharacterized protein F5147DRAFT_656953 [Suillus discolor]KAG2095307.1 hypothetical protein F5147DRAFT_656953 [Suillus discolor]
MLNKVRRALEKGPVTGTFVMSSGSPRVDSRWWLETLALVHWLYPQERLRAPNVIGTLTAAELASTKKQKLLVFVSSTSEIDMTEGQDQGRASTTRTNALPAAAKHNCSYATPLPAGSTKGTIGATLNLGVAKEYQRSDRRDFHTRENNWKVLLAPILQQFRQLDSCTRDVSDYDKFVQVNSRLSAVRHSSKVGISPRTQTRANKTLKTLVDGT